MEDALPQDNPRRLGGRPSQREASLIRERILDTATDAFLTNGYGATSIESIAKLTGISKRTFYHRFDDKADLFGAVVHRLLARLRPAEVAPLFTGGSLEEILQRIARFILQASLSPEALALHRLLISEGTRFPELAIILDTEGSRREAIGYIATLLTTHAQNRQLALENAGFAAEQFMQLVVAVPQRRALVLGKGMSPAEIHQWCSDTVALFLRGIYSPA